jgi:hypothetical protein
MKVLRPHPSQKSQGTQEVVVGFRGDELRTGTVGQFIRHADVEPGFGTTTYNKKQSQDSH